LDSLLQRSTFEVNLTVELLHIKDRLHCRTDVTQHDSYFKREPVQAAL
jgi:hypothetical protein